MNKPTCNVHGLIAPRAMCGHVIVGMKYCGFGGHCEHKSHAEMIEKRVAENVAAPQSTAQTAQEE